METLSYWLARIEPLIRAETEDEIIVIFANRTGTEEEAVYAGTSAVLGVQAGEVKVYGILGRGEKELLVVDTDKRPQAKLVSEPGASPVKKDTKAVNGDRTKHKLADPASLDHQAHSLAVDEAVTPLSPVEPVSHHAYFVPKGHGGADEIQQHQNLKSSSRQSELPHRPKSPVLKRPESPKSRNASRTRQSDQDVPPRASKDGVRLEKAIQKPADVKLPPFSAPIASNPAKQLSNAAVASEGEAIALRPKSAVW